LKPGENLQFFIWWKISYCKREYEK